MKIKNFMSLLFITLLIFSCSSSSGDDLDPNPNPDPNPNAVTYNDDIASIMTSNCTGCHGNPTTNNAPFSLTTFSQVSSRINQIITAINNSSNPMPPSGLMAQSTRDLIQKWKDEGLLEN